MTPNLERVLRWSACYNIRDLGGFPTQDGRLTAWGAIVRSDSPRRLTEDGWRALADYGVRTIVDLRTPAEIHPDERRPDDGIRYVHLPLLSEADFSSPRIVDARSTHEFYIAALDVAAPSFARVVRTIARASDGGVLIHCAVGRDRTGLVTGVLLALAGVADEAIADDYAVSRDALQPLVEEWLRDADEPAVRERIERENRCTRDSMLASLAHLRERYGGAAPFLEAAGASRGDLDRVRCRLLGA